MNTLPPNHDDEKDALQAYGRLDRLKFWLVSLISYWVIYLVGRSLRWESEGLEIFDGMRSSNRRAIYVFWHGRIFAATYFFRNQGVVVMTSQARDGEYIGRVIQRFGYGTARGSSSRGRRRALDGMIDVLQHKNNDVVFTIDGPRGPRYIAKPGAVWLAARTGFPVIPFSVCAEKKWVSRSWDRFHIPKPFSRAVVLFEPPICVKQGASAEEMAEAQQLVQRSLETLLEREGSYWQRSKAKQAASAGRNPC